MADTFDKTMKQAKTFCQDISTLKLAQINPQAFSQHAIDYQSFANQQSEAEHCYVSQLNKYLDVVSSLGTRYDACKSQCYIDDPQLKKDIQKRDDDNKNKSEYFHPMSYNFCLRDCRDTFYYSFKRTSKYFIEDHGFYIESSKDFIQ
eukprot:403340249